MVQIQRTKDEVFERAKELYENLIKDQLTDDQLGMYLSIDVDSSDYEIGEKSLDTALSLKARRPNASIFTMMHGSYTTVSMGFYTAQVRINGFRQARRWLLRKAR